MKKLIFSLIFLIFILFTLGFCIKVLLILKGYSREIKRNQELVLDFPAQITRLDTDIEQLNLKLKALENVIDRQTSAVENLFKAKYALFDKVSSLESGLEDLKKAKQQITSELDAIKASTTKK